MDEGSLKGTLKRKRRESEAMLPEVHKWTDMKKGYSSKRIPESEKELPSKRTLSFLKVNEECDYDSDSELEKVEIRGVEMIRKKKRLDGNETDPLVKQINLNKRAAKVLATEGADEREDSAPETLK